MMVRWSEQDYAAVLAGRVPVRATRVRRSKYGNAKTTRNGVRYDSKLEARRAEELDLRVKVGTVLWYTRQVSFLLEGGVRYRADFLAALAAGGVEVIDATGFMTPTKRMKLKQMKARYGIDVRVWNGGKSV